MSSYHSSDIRCHTPEQGILQGPDPRDPHESLTARRAYASVPHLGFDGWS